MGPAEAFTTVSVVAIIGATVNAVVRQLVSLRAGRRAPEAVGGADARLARLEAAVETVAVEVERIADGQRFTTRLLAERGAPREADAYGAARGERPRSPNSSGGF